MKSEFFDVRSNASLVVDNLSVIQQDSSSLSALIKLHPGSLVEAKGCSTLYADTLINGSTDVSTVVLMMHATGSRGSLSYCHISPLRGQPQPSRKQTKSADERRVNISVVERSLRSMAATPAWGGVEDYQRRLNDNNCPQGYDGACEFDNLKLEVAATWHSSPLMLTP